MLFTSKIVPHTGKNNCSDLHVELVLVGHTVLHSLQQLLLLVLVALISRVKVVHGHQCVPELVKAALTYYEKNLQTNGFQIAKNEWFLL